MAQTGRFPATRAACGHVPPGSLAAITDSQSAAPARFVIVLANVSRELHSPETPSKPPDQHSPCLRIGKDKLDFGLGDEIAAHAGAALDVPGRGADAQGLCFQDQLIAGTNGTAEFDFVKT